MSSSVRCASLAVLLLLSSCSDDSSAPADLAVGDAVLDRGGERGPGDRGPSCDELKAEFTVQVENAKSCQPQSASKECTRLLTQDALPCGCPILVNPVNATAIRQIDELLAAWRRSCGPKVECNRCPTPTSATCEATPAGSKVPGLCKSAR